MSTARNEWLAEWTMQAYKVKRAFLDAVHREADFISADRPGCFAGENHNHAYAVAAVL